MALENMGAVPGGGPEQADSQPAPAPREPRQRVLLRASLHKIVQQGSVHVTDLTREGLSGTVNLNLSVGQRIFVSLDDLTHCSGMVRWSKGYRFGLKFDNPVDVITCDNNFDDGTSPDHQTRVERLAADLTATLFLCDAAFDARIRNVSKSGMMIETHMPIKVHTRLVVSLSNGHIHTAEVRWADGRQGGLRLLNPVSILQFTYGGL